MSSSASSTSPRATISSSASSSHPPTLLRAESSILSPAARWTHLPSDLLRVILSYVCIPKTVWQTSQVCTHWRLSLDHPSTWHALVLSSHWYLPSSISSLSDSRIRTFFVARTRAHRKYTRAYWSRRTWTGHTQAGVIHLTIPKTKKFYSWQQGEQCSIDENVVISVAMPYGMKIWKMIGMNEEGVPASPTISSSPSSSSSASSASSSITCVGEHHVFVNPLAALSRASNNTLGNNSGAIDANLTVRWSCVDIYTTALADGVDETQQEEDEFTMSHTNASNTRPQNFLLFAREAASHPSLLNMYDLATKKLRALKPGHESAICCVKIAKPMSTTSNSSSSTAADLSSAPISSIRLAASGSYDCSTCIWDIDNGSLLARLWGGNTRTIWSVDLHADGLTRLIASAGDDHRIRIFALDPLTEEERVWEEERHLTADERKKQRSEKKREEMERLLGKKKKSTDTNENEVKEDETPFVSRYTNDGRFKLPPEEPAPAPIVPEVELPIIGIGPDGQILHAPPPAAPAAPPRAPDDIGGTHIALLTGHTKCVMTVQFDPHEPLKRLWSGGYDREIRVWDISGIVKEIRKARVRKEERVKKMAATTTGATSSSSSSSSSTAPLLDDDDVSLLFSPPCLRVFTGHTSVIFSLCLTRHVCISTSRDGSVRIWDKDSGVLLRSIDAGRQTSALVSEIAAGSHSSDAASLASERASSHDIKCAVVTQRGDIVTAASDGRISLISFEQHPVRNPAKNGSADLPAMRRTNSNSAGQGGSVNNGREDCCIM